MASTGSSHGGSNTWTPRMKSKAYNHNVFKSPFSSNSSPNGIAAAASPPRATIESIRQLDSPAATGSNDPASLQSPFKASNGLTSPLISMLSSNKRRPGLFIPSPEAVNTGAGDGQTARMAASTSKRVLEPLDINSPTTMACHASPASPAASAASYRGTSPRRRTATQASSSQGSLASLPSSQQGFDMSEWQARLDIIASTPTNRDFPPSIFPTRHSPPQSVQRLHEQEHQQHYLHAADQSSFHQQPKRAPLSRASSNSLGRSANTGHPRDSTPPSRLPVPKHVIGAFQPWSTPAAQYKTDRQPLAPAASAQREPNKAIPHSSASPMPTLAAKRSVKPLSVRTNVHQTPAPATSKPLAFSSSKSLASARQNLFHKSSQHALTAADEIELGSSFDEASMRSRHRHRAFSITESEMSEGVAERSIDFEPEKPLDSPDFVTEATTMTHQPAQADGDAHMAALGEICDPSPFLDSPGRRKGGSLPFKSASRAPLSVSTKSNNEILPSRPSYPPVSQNLSLYSEQHSDERASVFLSSLLRAGRSPSAGTLQDVGRSEKDNSEHDHTQNKLSRSHGPLSSNAHSTQTGKKRNAHGAIVSVSGPSEAARHFSPGEAFLSARGSLEEPRRKSLDTTSGTDSEGCRSATLPGLTDSSSVESNLSASQRSNAPRGSRDGLQMPSDTSLDSFDASDCSMATDSTRFSPIKRSSPRKHASSPHLDFKFVKPLAAAFATTGLSSKKERGRTRAERDSGVGVGGHTPLYRRFFGSKLGTDSPNTSFADTTIASTASDSPVFHIPGSAESSFAASPAQKKSMPDTPCKPSQMLTKSRIPLAAQVRGLHPLAHSIKPSPARSTSSSSSRSSTSSVVNSINGSAKKKMSLDPRNLVDNSPSAGRITHDGSLLTGPVSLQRRRPELFRRRSSGHLDFERGSPDTVPMTPTRVDGRLDVPHLTISSGLTLQLTGSPEDQGSVASTPGLSPISPLCPNTPSFMVTGSGHALSLPRGPAPGTQPQRPVYRRAHHSSSYVDATKQANLASPERLTSMFRVDGVIGEGEFSEALRVEERITGQLFAVKKTKQPFNGYKSRVRQLEEVDILRLLTSASPACPYLIQFYDAWEHAGVLHIQTELCTAGNLGDFLLEYGRLFDRMDEGRVWKILSELSAGIEHIHSNGVLHLDIKPANIFITSSGGLKIGDFGLATRWPRVDDLTILQGANVQTPGAGGVIGRRDEAKLRRSGGALVDFEREGDREYIAPEILQAKYGPAADMFSLGLVILEAATNIILPDNGAPWRKLRENDFSDVTFGDMSQPLVSVITKLLEANPAVRCTSAELKGHPVVQKLRVMRANGIRNEQTEAYEPPVLPMAKGAIEEEDSDFLAHLFDDATLSWRALDITPHAEAGNQMDVDL